MECARVIRECPYLLAFGRGGQRLRPNSGNSPFLLRLGRRKPGDLVREFTMGWPDAWFQASLIWMAITCLGFYEFLFSIECRHIVFPEYKKFLIEIRLDQCSVICA
jgi:hypothetical protein